MFDGSRERERLGPPPFRLPRPRRAALVRWAVAASLLALAALVLVVGSPARHVTTACREPAPPGPRRPVPPTGMVGVPVSLGSSGAARVVRPGDRIDVLAPAAGQPPALLAADVLVLSVQTGDDPVAEGATLYVAALPLVARRLAGGAPDARFAITVRPP